MAELIKVLNLVKSFGENKAVKSISFDIIEGEIFGLLGPNGAGKSTTISMICGLLEPTGGDVLVGGKSVRKEPMVIKRILGLVPQDIALYPTLSARENLHFWGRMYGLKGSEIKKRTEEVLEIVGLSDRANERVETYSGGMKRRINIAAGILHNPKILIMDEPTVGIDPQSRNHILETVQRLNKEGMTVIYTSHYMEEVEQLCSRIGIIDHGELIAMGTKAELYKMAGDGDQINLSITEGSSQLIDEVKNIPEVRDVILKDENITIICSQGDKLMAQIVALLVEKGVKITAVNLKEPNLESVFLHLTGRALRD